MYYISVFIGIIIVLISIILIRNEFKKSLDLKISNYGDFSDVEKRKLIEVIEELEDEINNLNEAFYEIVNDLEGKYSIHEKQIEMLEDKIKNMEEKRNAKTKEPSAKNAKVNESLKFSSKELSVRDKALRMKAEGESLNKIAKKLNVGIGELNLLLKINEENN